MPENLMDVMQHPLTVVVLAYLLGSLSFAVIVSKFMGLSDPRSYGSKNPGATNVLRSGNKKAAVLTLLFDAVKGYVPVAVLLHYGAAYGLTEGVAAAAGLAAFLGHLYPVFFKFEGGKGVATALGVLMGISPLLGLAVAITWLGIAWYFRYSSLAALLAAVLAPVYYAMAADGPLWDFNGAIFGMLCVMGVLLVWRHRDNVNRLLAGTETKLGAKKS
ncbi:MAG: putative glycerol-3-phosphate acyltransferase [Pseudomonadota bacterium]|jgi:glycerol-3-phosphate acyltransferase PlsY